MEKITQRIRDVQHFGEEGGVVPALDVAATSTFLNPSDMEKAFHGELAGCYLYSRHSNPTVKAFGEKLAAMEGAISHWSCRGMDLGGRISTYLKELGLYSAAWLPTLLMSNRQA